MTASPMPTVKRWADDLRAAFGADEMQAAMKSQGYYASEGGRTIDTRKPIGGTLISAADMVIGPQAEAEKRGARGR